MATPKPSIRYRDAEKGTYTTPQYAKTHPKTTVKETDRPKGKSK